MPTIGKIIIFLILILAWFYLPFIPIKVIVMCNIPPCNPITSGVSLYQIIFEGKLNSSYLFATPFTFIVPIVELIVLYFITSIINLTIINKKSGLFIKDFLKITKLKLELLVLFLCLFAAVFAMRIRFLALIIIFPISPFWDLSLPLLIIFGALYLYLLSCTTSYIWTKLKT